LFILKLITTLQADLAGPSTVTWCGVETDPGSRLDPTHLVVYAGQTDPEERPSSTTLKTVSSPTQMKLCWVGCLKSQRCAAAMHAWCL